MTIPKLDDISKKDRNVRCPFCNKIAFMTYIDFMNVFQVFCDRCGGSSHYHSTLQGAIKEFKNLKSKK